MRQVFYKMRYTHSSKFKDEIKRKLAELYSESPYSNREVLDFDKGYDFFSNCEDNMIKYSSKWFTPEKYDHLNEKFRHIPKEEEPSHTVKITSDEGNYRNCGKNEPAWKLERLGLSGNHLTRDLEKLGRTPYHLGIEGEKFRVVAATLQKCNSPFVRRTFQFTSNGIVETPEVRNDTDQMKLFPVINQTKKGMTQKLVTIRRFRVIKKDNITGEKTVFPHKVKVVNGEKPRFLTVRIRSKERQNYEEVQSKNDFDSAPEVVRLTSSTEEEDCDYSERVHSPPTQAEETDDGEEFITKTNAENIPPELKNDPEAAEDKKTEELNSNDTDEAPSFDYEDFGKRFSTYPGIFTDFRSEQQQSQTCSKKFITAKPLHAKSHQRYTRSCGTVEDRIKTATSKFGRTRRVLNIAGLRSKYKML